MLRAREGEPPIDQASKAERVGADDAAPRRAASLRGRTAGAMVALGACLPLAVASEIFDWVAPHPDGLWAILEILASRALQKMQGSEIYNWAEPFMPQMHAVFTAVRAP